MVVVCMRNRKGVCDLTTRDLPDNEHLSSWNEEDLAGNTLIKRRRKPDGDKVLWRKKASGLQPSL